MNAQIKNHYIAKRLQEIDLDFLSFEEDLITENDLQLVMQALENGVHFKNNPYNSIILYVCGLTDEFDFKRERADTIGGTPPDLDIDFEALGRSKAMDWVVEEWGRNQVANIMTQGTFKPKSLTRRYFKITEGSDETMREILRAIPPAVFGKEADMEKILEASPALQKNPKYSDWLYFANSLEGMINNFGIHAAGVVISDFPIPDTIPCWKNSKSEFITQYDMHEVEELGSIKFDFLVILNLDILKECVRLIEVNHGKKYDIYDLPDFDKKAYALMADGLLTGIFQMETSGTAKNLIQKIRPSNWEELSDISALNRPGPMSAGLDDMYIENKNNGYAPADMPPAIAEVLKTTYWTLVYQEQVMQLCQLAGFTLQEADNVRRAMGKKKHNILGGYKIQFVEGLVKENISREYAENLWVTLAGDPDDPDNNGFADYCFNKSHSLAYSVVTYLSAYFKANYATEFFTALMTIRSQVMQPKLWAQKAPEFVNDAKQMNIKIQAPYIQKSKIGFSIETNEIYFGFNAINGVGATASESIILARNQGAFKDIWDFLARVNRQKVTTATFKALVLAGAFDRMGYRRKDLLKHHKDMFKWFTKQLEYEQRLVDIELRNKENEQKDNRKEELAKELAEAKKIKRQMKKSNLPVPEYIEKILNRDSYLREIRKNVRLSGGEPEEVLFGDDLELYRESVWLRKKPNLKPKEVPEKPNIERTRSINITVLELMDQAKAIGCYLHDHPAPTLYPDTTRVGDAEEGHLLTMAGQITSFKQIKTKRGQDMAFAEMGDGTGLVELVIFPKSFAKLSFKDKIPQTGDIVSISCEVETADDSGTKVFVSDLNIHEISLKTNRSQVE